MVLVALIVVYILMLTYSVDLMFSVGVSVLMTIACCALTLELIGFKGENENLLLKEENAVEDEVLKRERMAKRLKALIRMLAWGMSYPKFDRRPVR